MSRQTIAFSITLFRGILAISLGAALLFYPDKARPMLGNFMGMYWLGSGIISLRWGVGGRRSGGVWLAAGIIGVLAGIAMLSRSAARNVVPEATLFYVLGSVILFTGLLHIFGGFRTGEPLSREWSVASLLLGIFEVVLGLVLISAPTQFGPALHVAAGAWALLGGAILIGDAMRARRRQASA
jgi:uncharacterized membrane protein HdeD (DUF308 family)